MRFPGRLLVAVLMMGAIAATSIGHAGAAATDPACPPGTSPNRWMPVGDLYLPTGAIPYSTILLTRLRLAPGETLPAELDVPIMYVVESGVLEYPSQPGVGILDGAPICVRDDGHFSGGGSFTITEDNFVPVSSGMTMIAEHGLEGPLRNGGTVPLVVLEVRIITPEIDPVSGLPMIDPAIAGREQSRDLRLLKEACKARKRALAEGTPISQLPAVTPTPDPSPAFTTVGWSSNVKQKPDRVPRACNDS